MEKNQDMKFSNFAALKKLFRELAYVLRMTYL